MIVKTGEEITTHSIVDIQYRCSSCGKDILTTDTVKGYAHTSTILGINIDPNYKERAVNEMNTKLADVLDQNNPERFKIARFTCKCKNCGYAEPWARMNYKKLEKPTAISIAFMIISIIALFGSLNEVYIELEQLLFPFIIFVLSTAVHIGINLYKSLNDKKMEELIDNLPPASVPGIFPYSRERHCTYNNVSMNYASAEDKRGK